MCPLSEVPLHMHCFEKLSLHIICVYLHGFILYWKYKCMRLITRQYGSSPVVFGLGKSNLLIVTKAMHMISIHE